MRASISFRFISFRGWFREKEIRRIHASWLKENVRFSFGERVFVSFDVSRISKVDISNVHTFRVALEKIVRSNRTRVTRELSLPCINIGKWFVINKTVKRLRGLAYFDPVSEIVPGFQLFQKASHCFSLSDFFSYVVPDSLNCWPSVRTQNACEIR